MRQAQARDWLYRLIKKESLARLLALYGIGENFSWRAVYGGWRKACFKLELAERSLLLALYPPGSFPRSKIERGLFFEQLVAASGLPARAVIRTINGRFLVSCLTGQGRVYGALFRFYPGRAIHPYGREQIREAGVWLGRLHRRFRKADGTTLVHGDFARGNLLFDSRGKFIAMIDFEEAHWGRAKEDCQISLDFFYQDCQLPKEEVKEIFLNAYARH